jgi:hypothetical protein
LPNLLALLPHLTDEELAIIAEAMRRYNPTDFTDPAVIGLLNRERVIVALQVYGTAAALALACKLLKA